MKNYIDLMGYAKLKRYYHFPVDWIKPGEIRYDATKEVLLMHPSEWLYRFWVIPIVRRYILRKPIEFWIDGWRTY